MKSVSVRSIFKDSRFYAIALNGLVLLFTLALFMAGKHGDWAIQDQHLSSQRQIADHAAAASRPAIGQTYTAALDIEATTLLNQEHELQISTAQICRSLFERMTRLTGCAILSILLALLLVMRNSCMSRKLRIGILASQSIACLLLLFSFGLSVRSSQTAFRAGQAPVPNNLLDFETAGHAQIGKIYTARRHEVLFQFLETDRAITAGLLKMIEGGEEMATNAPGLVAGLTVLNIILMTRIRTAPEHQCRGDGTSKERR